MARQTNKLSARAVQTLMQPGRHSDGGGLYLVIDKNGAKRWVFIYRRKRDGKQSEMGLGGLDSVPLARAREIAAECRANIAAGLDPLAKRRAEQTTREIPTFAAFAEEVIAALETGWRNDKHKAQWRSTLTTHAKPLAGMRVDEIEVPDVLKVLRPIWTKRAETASRLRGRIEKVLDAATAQGLRGGINPARWKGNLDHLLGRRQKLQRGHHPAMPWQEVPGFLASLRERQSMAALALEFTILTTTRSGEVRLASWDEIDFDNAVWIIPAERMKAGREHRVPLLGRALDLLRELADAKTCALIFPGAKAGKPLSDMSLSAVLRRMEIAGATVHGFRSSFKDWAHEATSYPNELSEAALAHITGDATERAYRRGDALARRREMMAAWERFCMGGAVGNVVALPGLAGEGR